MTDTNKQPVNAGLVHELRLPNAANMNPVQARKLVSQIMAQAAPQKLNSAINYEDVIIDGVTARRSRSAFPIIQYAATHRANQYSNGFKIFGFGEAGAQALQDITWAILKVAPNLGQPQVRTHKTSASKLAEGRKTFFVPRMVVQKSREHTQALQDPVTGLQHLEKLFKRSIQRQAHSMGVALPEDFSVWFAGSEFQRSVLIKEGRPHNLALFNSKFQTDLNLSGIWSVGYHLSFGFGHFNASGRGLVK